MVISERGRHWKRTLRTRRNVETNPNAAPTLSGLRVFRVGGVCLLEVVAGPERGGKTPQSVSQLSRPKDAALVPGVAASAHAAAVAEEEQQREQDQGPPGKDAQQHQQQHIVLRLACRHGHLLGKKQTPREPVKTACIAAEDKSKYFPPDPCV